MGTTDTRRRGLVLALALLPLGARSHGDAHQPAGPAKREQTDWGIAGDARAVRRTVDVRMTDTMRFTPDRIAVREGETLRLRVHNAGRLMHEFVIGTPATLDEHAKLMEKFPDMEHDEPSKLSLAPGKQGEIIWQFTKAGTVNFACLMPGHYEAGMKGAVKVSKK